MLYDVLGVAIAFLTIIVLLSVLVTALVQASQAVLRLRARNLLKGIGALILNQREGAGAVSFKESHAAKRDAMKVLNTSYLALGNRITPFGSNSKVLDSMFGPNSPLRYWLIGPRVSWTSAKDLHKALEEAGIGLKEHEITKITNDFKRMEIHISKRFQTITRGWSFVWAFLVAFVLQVSAPALLNRVATDAPYRERILADTEKELTNARETLAKVNYEAAAASALEEMARRHPDLRERIERASGKGVNKEFIVDELRLALGVSPQDALLREYEQLLDENAGRDSATLARQTLGRLAVYNIGVWEAGLDFYYREPPKAPRNGEAADSEPQPVKSAGTAPKAPSRIIWSNLIGVLMTAILLSLGAPFWFEQLRVLGSLRDSLSGKGKP